MESMVFSCSYGLSCRFSMERNETMDSIVSVESGMSCMVRSVAFKLRGNQDIPELVTCVQMVPFVLWMSGQKLVSWTVVLTRDIWVKFVVARGLQLLTM